MRSRDMLIGLAMLFGLTAYCIVLLVSKEAPVRLLAVTGFASLTLIVLSTWGFWHRLSKAPE